MTPALHWNPYVVPPHTLPEIGKPWSVCAVHVCRGAALATEGRNPAATAIRSEKATTRFLVIVCWRTHTTGGSGRTVPRSDGARVRTRSGSHAVTRKCDAGPPGARATSVARSRA